MGAVNTTYTFTATDTITSTKMNNIIDETTITDDAIIGTTLEVASGKLKVRSQGITSNELAAGSVTSNAIADGTIVNADISATAAISMSKIATGALPSAITVTTANIVDGSVTSTKLSGNQTGSAPIYGIRAWASVDSTGSIKRAQNISSVTRSSAGIYTFDFSVNIPVGSYAIVATTESVGTFYTYNAEFYDKTSAGFKIRTSARDPSGDKTYVDSDFDVMVIA